MNPEELRMIADTITSLGVAGKTAFIWWLVVDKALPVIGWLATLGTLLAFARGPINKLIINTQTSTYIQNLRDSWGIGGVGYLTESELREVQKRIAQLERSAPREDDSR